MSTKKFLKAAQEIRDKARKPDVPKAAASHDESNWLVSYADMMTLLCGFFIMLFSMSKMDEPQYEKVKQAMSEQFGGDYKSESKELAKFVTEVVQEAGIETQTTVKTEGQGVTVAFQSTLFFDTLSADVKGEGRQILEKLSKDLAERQKAEGKQYQIVVEGHTDSRPVTAGSFSSNWELSGARASRVVRYFLDAHFAPNHMTAIGYADTRPEVDARGPNGVFDDALLAKNRRVVLRILSGSADAIPFPKEEASTPPTAEASVNSPAAQTGTTSAISSVPQRTPAAAAPAAPDGAKTPANTAH